MTLELTENERTKLAVKGVKAAPIIHSFRRERIFDALWVGRDEQGTAIIRAWLEVTSFLEGLTHVYAWATAPGTMESVMRKIPEKEIVWLFLGPRPPGHLARVQEVDPIMFLPGEADAYRLRRVLGVAPVAMISPSNLISRHPEFSLDLRVRSPSNNLMNFGCRRLKSKVRFVVEHHREGGIREASAGFSLIWWSLPQPSNDRKIFDWNSVPAMEAKNAQPFLRLFEAYQALRLPGLRLLLEYRASRASDAQFIQSMADSHFLPVPLVARRLMLLHQFAQELDLF